MKQLTNKQHQILTFIEKFNEQEGMPPTVYELGQHFSIRPTTAFAHIRALQRKGYVSRSSKARSLTVLRSKQPRHFSMALSIPVLGRISAGLPLFAEEQVEDNLHIDVRSLPGRVPPDQVFGLRVTGDSMRNAGILDGDILIARQSQIADNGDIVIALVEDETTVKHLYFSEQGIELHPANPAFDIQVYHSENVFIQGIAVALQRTLCQ